MYIFIEVCACNRDTVTAYVRTLQVKKNEVDGGSKSFDLSEGNLFVSFSACVRCKITLPFEPSPDVTPVMTGDLFHKCI